MAELHTYDVIRRPVITEKSNILSDEANKYVFEVAMNANKIQIREAVSVIFGLKLADVTAVNTMIVSPKRGRRGRKWYMRTKTWKKAVVTLAPGHKIELFDV